jgi:hypothetical protein
MNPTRITSLVSAAALALTLAWLPSETTAATYRPNFHASHPWSNIHRDTHPGLHRFEPRIPLHTGIDASWAHANQASGLPDLDGVPINSYAFVNQHTAGSAAPGTTCGVQPWERHRWALDPLRPARPCLMDARRQIRLAPTLRQDGEPPQRLFERKTFVTLP